KIAYARSAAATAPESMNRSLRPARPLHIASAAPPTTPMAIARIVSSSGAGSRPTLVSIPADGPCVILDSPPAAILSRQAGADHCAGRVVLSNRTVCAGLVLLVR